MDPTYRLSGLKAANNKPISVSPQKTVTEAVTIMMVNDFSQLPVMSGDRTVVGVISLASLAKRWALGAGCERVQDCLENAHILAEETSLFDAIDDIIKNEYVLVQRNDRRIAGIVTTSDLSHEFRRLAEPFLLLGEVEQHIRALIERGGFSERELAAFRDERDAERPVSAPSHFTLGECIRLLENSEQWDRLKLSLDRVAFLAPLRKIRDLRNKIMHFDPDPVVEEDLVVLRNFVTCLQQLREIVYKLDFQAP